MARFKSRFIKYSLALCAAHAGLSSLLHSTALAQAVPAAPANPSEIFSPIAFPTAVNQYRSGDGTPGPNYWKNEADYKIDVKITPEGHQLSGSEVITYQNNSPSDLPSLWLHLEQNLYRSDSRAANAAPFHFRGQTDGITIEKVTIIDAKGHETPIEPFISDTRMQLRLPTAMKKGSKISFRVVWHYTVPGPWGGRTAVSDSKNGEIYEIAQFYPRMAVFDDLRGWDTLPYLGGEFYLDYGKFDYSVTVPANFIVAGSGALVNPQDVLSSEERKRLVAAGKSETRILIHDQKDVEAESKDSKLAGQSKTWRFHMENSRDVAFVASPAFLWDAAKIDLPAIAPAPGMPVAPRLAMSVYPVEAIGPQAWDRSTEYVKHTIEYFSHEYYEYPWPNAVNVGGHGAAMEYPGIVFDGQKDRDAKLFWITTHELGHGWFPMIVGSNERRHGFMDEGFNTFIDSRASLAFNKGEFAPKKDGEYSPDTGVPADDIVKVLKNPIYHPLMVQSNIPEGGDRHAMTYFKAAYGLELLRSQILGPDRFNHAFRHYIAQWAYKHPTPSDFFRAMDSDAGEDLSWFWRGWYFENWSPDYAIASVTYVDNDVKKGAQIKIVNKGSLDIPVDLAIKWDDGSSTRLRIPFEAWSNGHEHVVNISGGKAVLEAVLDPDHAIPDIDRSNNSFTSHKAVQ